MLNKHLEVFEMLDKLILNFPTSKNNFFYIKQILDAQLKRIQYSDDESFLPEKVSRKKLYAKFSEIDESKVKSSVAREKINVDKLKKALDQFIFNQPDCKRAFQQIGFLPYIESSIPEVGTGNEVLLWIDIKTFDGGTENIDVNEGSKLDSNSISNEISLDIRKETTEDNFNSDIYYISYERLPSDKVKAMLWLRPFFSNGEMKIYSVKGFLLILLMTLGFIADIYILLFSILFVIYMKDLPNLKFWEAILFLAFIPMSYFVGVWVYRPIHHLMTYRVSKAPLMFASVNTDNADMEMYKGDSKFRIARITAFQSVCPICSAPIQIDYGKPDHRELLVGRCRESPLAHVYSFDRDTLKGFFLGHKGFLKEDIRGYNNT